MLTKADSTATMFHK